MEQRRDESHRGRIQPGVSQPEDASGEARAKPAGTEKRGGKQYTCPMDPEVTSSRQIRSSVIMGWLKQYNIRQVQYMAGHKSIRSTESYRLQDLTDLTRQLELFHPLR